MSIGFFFVIVICVTLFSFGNVEKLFLAAIFFAPFSSSVVITVGDKILQPGHAFLFIMLLFILIKGKINIYKPNKFLFIFVIWCLITILIAAVFGIDETVYGIGNGVSLTNSKVSTQSFTQFIYLFCCFLIYLFTVSFCLKSDDMQEKVIRTYVLSGVTILGICIYQYFASIFNLPYDMIFRNTIDTWQSIDRIQGVMPEASLLGQHCILILPLIVFYYKRKKIIRLIVLGVMLFIGVYSRSSTFLLGIAALLIAYIILCQKTAKRLLICAFLIIGSIVGFILAYQYVAMFTRLVDLTISKIQLSTESGIERSSVSNYMFDIWTDHPISGIGYGCGRSLNLYTNLLSTTGIIGFILYMLPIVRWTIISFLNKNEKFSFTILLIIIGYFITSFAVPDITYLNVWVFLGIIDVHYRYRDCKICSIIENQKN